MTTTKNSCPTGRSPDVGRPITKEGRTLGSSRLTTKEMPEQLNSGGGYTGGGSNSYPAITNGTSKYLTTKELAKHLSISESTLIAYRTNQCGPAYKKIGRMVRYNVNEVHLWIERENKLLKNRKSPEENSESEFFDIGKDQNIPTANPDQSSKIHILKPLKEKTTTGLDI